MTEKRLKWGQLKTQKDLQSVLRKYDWTQTNKYSVDVQSLKGYATGSIYVGEWSATDMDGIGTFILPHGVVYEGHMKDGMFHGKGVLIYPLGQMVVGEWYEGEITSWRFKYRNIEQCKLETYCKQPDRRFLTTLYNELLPAGREYLTNAQPTRNIPDGCYDVVDGFYNPKTLWVHSSKNFSNVLYMPAPRRIPVDINIFKDDGTRFIRKVPFVPIYRTSQWIEENCRKAWDESTGFKPEYYEYWFSGRQDHERYLDMKVESQGGKFVWNESICDEVLAYFELLADRKKRIREEINKQEKSRENVEEKSEIITIGSTEEKSTIDESKNVDLKEEEVEELKREQFYKTVTINDQNSSPIN
ncbi:hypothetical protein HHI36_016775 [Cryptolaemus montrouzieri]|uniref:MORN repeat-containing protein 5 n=1 Tax=Cryptolaemus montrouzieri TaxID=559131 RepID=A0ABD2NKP7_9CUCU